MYPPLEPNGFPTVHDEVPSVAMPTLTVVPERGGLPFRFDPTLTNAVRLNRPEAAGPEENAPWLFSWGGDWRLLVNRPRDLPSSEIAPFDRTAALSFAGLRVRPLAYTAAEPGSVPGVFITKTRAQNIVSLLGLADYPPNRYDDLPLCYLPPDLADARLYPVIDPALPPPRQHKNFKHPVLFGRWIGPPPSTESRLPNYPECEFAAEFADRFVLRKSWIRQRRSERFGHPDEDHCPEFRRHDRGIDLYHDPDVDRWVLVRGPDAGWPQTFWDLAKEKILPVKEYGIDAMPKNRFREYTPEMAVQILRAAGNPMPDRVTPDVWCRDDPAESSSGPTRPGSDAARGTPASVLGDPTDSGERGEENLVAPGAPPPGADPSSNEPNTIGRSEKVVLYRDRPLRPLVDSVERSLTEPQWHVVKALVDAYPKGLTKKELIDKSGRGGAIIILETLLRKPGWEDVIVRPGGPNKGGYRIR
ncbi:hypothetical protein [Alienimonas sp. DA493]|uniref:hypothetical protein n=1 Tax=Alienimonas sp. DA493 TaxID=3373605 RepID=UPI003754A5B0